jgi:Flp pilus assembly protein TadG
MKHSLSHRWRNIGAGHAALRSSSIAHAHSKRTLARRAAGAHGNRFGADISGAAAVEFGMILWPLMLLVVGIMDGGRMLWTQNSLQYAVEQAARYAVTSCTTTCATPAQIQSYAASKAYGMSLPASDFASNSAGCGAVAGTQVTASVPYSPIFPFPSTVTLTASSCRPT